MIPDLVLQKAPMVGFAMGRRGKEGRRKRSKLSGWIGGGKKVWRSCRGLRLIHPIRIRISATVIEPSGKLVEPFSEGEANLDSIDPKAPTLSSYVEPIKYNDSPRDDLLR